MKNRWSRWCLLISMCVAGLFSQSSVAADLTCSPVDNGRALINPGMGWQLYFYSNVLTNYGSQLAPEDIVEDFPGMSTVFLRLPWSFVEPERDHFNWEIIDTPAQRWLQSGRQVAFCISATENWTRQGTPQWVFDEGAKYYIVNGYLEPDYDDPVYLRAVEHFVQRMAERYDGKPEVAYVAIGHYGMWGEGHTELTTPVHHKSWGLKTQKKYIDIYTKHFRHTQLCLPDDYVGHDKPGKRFPITDYAFSKGVTIWDCSILVQPYPRHWYHSEMSQLFWPTMPVILEHDHYGNSKDRNAWNKDLLLQAIEDYHASYMSIHWWPRVELETNRDIIDKINLRMGYRINMPSAQWPAIIHKNQPFHIRSVWQNVGVAPCYGGGYPCFTIKNAQGGIVAVLVDTEFNVRNLKVGKPGEAPRMERDVEFYVARAFTNNFGTFTHTCPTGDFELYFSVGTIYGSPTLQLPYPNDDGHKRYKLGAVRIEN